MNPQDAMAETQTATASAMPAATGEEAPDRAALASLDREAAVASGEHAENILRLRYALIAGLVAWVCFVSVDWLVVSHIHPGSLAYYLVFRVVGVFLVGGGILATYREPAVSPRTIAILDSTVYTSVNTLIAVMALEYAGIVSPYYTGAVLVLGIRGAAIPVPWRTGLLRTGLPAIAYPLTFAVAAIFSESIRAQFSDGPTIAIFVHNLAFVFGSFVLVVLGSHFVWALRRQLFESRNIGKYRLGEVVAAGGMGEVWKAYHSGLKRNVIKSRILCNGVFSEAAPRIDSSCLT